MEEETALISFRVNCLVCQKVNRTNETNLYINWEKKYYLISCFTCGTSEAFNELGKRIEVEKEKSTLQVN